MHLRAWMATIISALAGGSIDEMTRDIEEYVWLRSRDGKGDTTEVQIEEEARRRIIEIGVSRNRSRSRLDRVLSCLYREAQRSGGSHVAL